MRHSSFRGFSYIEIIVSLFIVSALIAASGAVLKGVPLARQVKQQDLALKIAKNKIESIRASGYDSIPASGPFADALLSSLPSGAGELTTSAFNDETRRVTVTVSWKEPNIATSSIALDTLITEIGGL